VETKRLPRKVKARLLRKGALEVTLAVVHEGYKIRGCEFHGYVSESLHGYFDQVDRAVEAPANRVLGANFSRSKSKTIRELPNPDVLHFGKLGLLIHRQEGTNVTSKALRGFVKR